MFDDGDTFSDLLDDFHLMRDHDDGDAELLIDIFQQLQDGFDRFRIQRRGRFIGEKYGWIGHDSACDADTLLLSAGELCGVLIFVLGETDHLEDVIDAFLLLCLRHIGKLQRECDISCHCAGGQQVEMLEDHADAFALAAQFRLGELHHVFAIDQDFACGRWFKHIDAADQGRFPCTRLPDDTVDLTISDGDADVVQCFEIAIYFRYMFEFNHWSLLIKTKKLSSEDESLQSHHLSRIHSLELAPFHKDGCRGFKGPVPPPLMMKVVCNSIDKAD